MVKRIIIGSLLGFLIYCPVASASFKESFTKNIITSSSMTGRGKFIFVKVNYNALKDAERTALDAAIKKYEPHFAFCKGKTYYRYNSYGRIYEIQDFENQIFYRNDQINKSETLNGVIWKGSISIYIKNGVARYINGDGSKSQWMEMNSLLGEKGLNLPGIVFKNQSEILSNPNSSSFVDGEWSVPNSVKSLDCSMIENVGKVAENLDLNRKNTNDQDPIKVIEPEYSIQPNLDLISDSDLQGVSQTARVRIYVNNEGDVDNVQIISGTGIEALDQKISEIFSNVKFKPYLSNGIAFPFYTEQYYELRPDNITKRSNKSPTKSNLTDLQNAEFQLCKIGIKSKCN